MYKVDVYLRVRRAVAVMVEGMSIRERSSPSGEESGLFLNRPKLGVRGNLLSSLNGAPFVIVEVRILATRSHGCR